MARRHDNRLTPPKIRLGVSANERERVRQLVNLYRNGVELNTYLVVRQANNTSDPDAYYVYAKGKKQIQEWIEDWDSDDITVTYTTLVIKKVKDA